MLIVCPSCTSEYAIDSGRIGPAGRTVRCAACRQSWFIGQQEVDEAAHGASSPAETAAAEGTEHEVVLPAPPCSPVPVQLPMVVEPGPAVAGKPAAPRPRDRRRASRAPARSSSNRKGRTGLRAGACAATLILLALPAGILWRAGVVAALPGTAVLFSALGLPVNLLGLTLEGVTSSVSQEADSPVLVVTGTIANVAARPIRVPPLAIAVETREGEPLYRWSVESGAGELPSGQKASFRARLASPPPAARQVEVAFRPQIGSGQVALR